MARQLSNDAQGILNQMNKLSLPDKAALAVQLANGVAKAAASGEMAAALAKEEKALAIAQQMVDSYRFDKETGVSTFTVPVGVSDVEAMKAGNLLFRQLFPNANHAPVCEYDEWYKSLPTNFPQYCELRDYSLAPREVTIQGIVQGTIGANRTSQEQTLQESSLVFSDPRDQAIAKILHACTHAGQDLFRGYAVRGSVPGVALVSDGDLGTVVHGYDDGMDQGSEAASGSPA